MNSRIKNIIFDFGGIIVDLDKQAVIHAFEALGVDVRPYVGDYVQRGVFSAMETGEMSSEEFFDYLRQQAGGFLSDDVIRQAWNRMLTGIPSCRLRLIRQLREDYHTYMLSNTNALHWTYSCDTLLKQSAFCMEDCFDRIFLSFQMRLMKPDVRIFRRVLAETCVQPSATLFIDDSLDNCRAAEQVGMCAFHSRTADDWMALFEKEE